MSELQILYPQPELVRVGKRMVAVKAVEFRHFEAFGKASGELLSMLATATPAEIYRWAKNSGALEAVLGACTSLSAWRIRRLPAAVAVELMLFVVSVNSRFFDQALIKAGRLLVGAQSPSA